MASDFGDESGEKLFDWILHLGQRMSEEAMRDGAQKLIDAFRHARGEVGGEVVETTENVVRLKMDEFAALPEYESIKAIIDERLEREAIEHEFVTMEGKEYLLFRAKDAPVVAAIFQDLENQVEQGLARAEIELDKSKEAIERRNEKTHGDVAHDGHNEATAKTEKPLGAASEKPTRASDQEPLDERAKRAKASAQAIEDSKEVEREINPVEVKTK